MGGIKGARRTVTSYKRTHTINAHTNAMSAYTPVTTPADWVMQTWRDADAVCFDVDCTVTINDSLDLLALHMGVEDEVMSLTNQAMDGSMNLSFSLNERLRIINCTPADIKGFLEANPPADRLSPNIAKLISALQVRGIQVYLLTGGFRELVLPLAAHLGVPVSNILANRMNWQCDDVTGLPTRLVGYDPRQPTARNKGKPEAIALLRAQNPYNTVVMIGDGITDMEAGNTAGGADLFIGYGGVIERPAVASAADWFVYDHQELFDNLKSHRVAMVGSGAWATAAVKMVAENTLKHSQFVDNVAMWVHSQDPDIINGQHENPKYLPGVRLGDNVVACDSLELTVKDADVIIFCLPHQFILGVCKKLVGKIKPGAIAISLTKGMRVNRRGPQLVSNVIHNKLNIDCSVLMGANIALEVGEERLSEAVIGYSTRQNAEIFVELFHTPYFNVTPVNDAAGAEMCGTLKNIVARHRRRPGNRREHQVCHHPPRAQRDATHLESAVRGRPRRHLHGIVRPGRLDRVLLQRPQSPRRHGVGEELGRRNAQDFRRAGVQHPQRTEDPGLSHQRRARRGHPGSRMAGSVPALHHHQPDHQQQDRPHLDLALQGWRVAPTASECD